MDFVMFMIPVLVYFALLQQTTTHWETDEEQGFISYSSGSWKGRDPGARGMWQGSSCCIMVWWKVEEQDSMCEGKGRKGSKLPLITSPLPW